MNTDKLAELETLLTDAARIMHEDASIFDRIGAHSRAMSRFELVNKLSASAGDLLRARLSAEMSTEGLA